MRSNGFRRNTRKLISKDFKEHGKPGLSKIIQEYKVGDYVDCKIDASIVKGMPHKYFHGFTGVVYNCNPRSIGVVFNRIVRGKYIRRVMHIRVEHLSKSRCNEDAKLRYAKYAEERKKAEETGILVKPTKRMPENSRPAFCIPKVSNMEVIEVSNKPYTQFF